MVLLCDEDDLNRSSFAGNNAIERSNWQEPDVTFFAAANALLNKQFGPAAAARDVNVDSDERDISRELRDFQQECDKVAQEQSLWLYLDHCDTGKWHLHTRQHCMYVVCMLAI